MYNIFPLNELKVYEHHINCIFKCGMLVDEHVELLQQFLTSPKVKSNKFKWKIVSFSLFCGGIYSGVIKSVIPVIVGSIPLGSILMKDLIRYFKYKRCITRFENLTRTLRKISDFNKGVQKYYERRIGSLNKLEDSTKIFIEEVIRHKISNFIKHIFYEIDDLVSYMQKEFLKINIFIPQELSDVFNINLTGKITWSKDEDVTFQFKTLQMCYVLATSTYLLGIGLALCNQPEYIITNIIPNSEKFIIRKFKLMKNSLEETNYNLPETQITNNQSFLRTDSFITITKLLESLQLTYHACIATQQCVFKASEDLVKTQLIDLEKLLNESSNLLSILQHEYNYDRIVTNPTKVTQLIPTNESGKEITFRYDDINELMEDEEFEISIHASDLESNSSEGENLEYEQLKEQIRAQKMILKELNDELIKRKLVKEEFIDQKINPTKSKLKTGEDFECLNQENLCGRNMDFLAQIRAVAQNRGGEESVFGDDDFSE